MFSKLFSSMAHASRKMAETFQPREDETDLIKIRNNECPNCGTKGKWLEGPSGGMSINYACGGCGHKFNVGFGFGTGPIFCERIGVDEELVARIAVTEFNPATDSVMRP